MKKLENAAPLPPGFLLSEEGHAALQEVRDQLLLMATIAFAATADEESEPLPIRRSMLGALFESFGLRIDDVLTGLDWPGRKLQRPARKH